MSREMIEVVQRACKAWGTGDFDVFREIYTADVVAHGGQLWPETGQPARGVDDVVGNFSAITAMFERNELVPEAVIEAGDTLVVELLWRGLARRGSNFIEQRLAGTFTFRDARIASMAWFAGVDQALDALGLPHSAIERMIVLVPPPPTR